MARSRRKKSLEQWQKTGAKRPRFVLLLLLGTLFLALVIEHRLGKPDRRPATAVEPPSSRLVVRDTTSTFSPDLATWGTFRDDDPSGRRTIGAEGFAAARKAVGGQPWAWFKLDVAGFRRLETAAVLTRPGSLRALPIEVVGRLSSFGTSVPPFDKSSDKAIKWGAITATASVHGGPIDVWFVSVDDDPPIDLEKLVGGPVKLQGVFFQAADHSPSSTVAVVVARRVFRSYEIPAPDASTDAEIEKAVDAVEESDADRPVLDPPFFRLLGKVLARGPSFEDGALDISGKAMRRVLDHPEEYRGKGTRFAARCLRVERHAMSVFFEQTAPGDVEVTEFWTFYVTTDGNIPVTVVSTFPPPEGLVDGARIDVAAAFLKRYAYRSDAGVSRGPLFIATSPVAFRDERPKESRTSLGDWIFGLAFTGGVGLCIFLWMERRRSRRESKEYRARMAAMMRIAPGKAPEKA